MFKAQNELPKKIHKKRHKPRSSWIMYLWFIPNIKGRGPIYLRAEGSLEAMFIMKLMMDESITFITTDLESVEIAGRNRTYNPDLLFCTEDNALHYREVKNSKALNKPKTKERVRAITDDFKKHDTDFAVLTENDIAPGDMDKNIIRFFKFYTVSVPSSLIQEIQKVVTKDIYTLEALIQQCDKQGIENNRVAIWHMLAHQYLIVDDLAVYIGQDTIIKIGGRL